MKIQRIILTDCAGRVRVNAPLAKPADLWRCVLPLRRIGRLISPKVDSFGVLLATYVLTKKS